MKLPATSSERRREPIGPLVDVVFLLLVFFLLAGTLEPPGPIEVEPPASEHADPQTTRALRILLDAEGRIAVEGEVLDAGTLAGTIRARTGADAPRAVRVEADGEASAGSVLALLAQLRALGFPDLQLVTRPLGAAAGGD